MEHSLFERLINRFGFALVLVCVSTSSAWSLGTVAGTDIDNQATVSFDIGGTPGTATSNTVTVTVAEVLNVDVTLLSGSVSASSPATNVELLFSVTNTGNGTEDYTLAIDNSLAGDDFNPTGASPAAIYIDTDSSGDFSGGDTAYNPGSPPTLAPDETIEVLLVNDIPTALPDGSTGFSELTAAATTGSGSPGDRFPGQGDGGIDAIVGTSGASDADNGEYIIGDIQLDVVKSAVVSDPFGGTDPIPGADITYTIVVTPSGSDTAANAVFTDPIPTNTTYQTGTLSLNSTTLTDTADGDAGEYQAAPTPQVSVGLGDLTGASGAQTIEFTVTID
ncbi:MAG: hypothetical protein ACR2QG_00265 [Gammaproteobacteria bacterium]